MKPELEARRGFLASVFTVEEFRDALRAESVFPDGTRGRQEEMKEQNE